MEEVSDKQIMQYSEKANLLFIDPDNLDIPIFRFYPIERLFQIFIKQKNTLVKPSLWDDTFENPLGKQTFYDIDDHEKKRPHDIGDWDRHYGQCWSLEENETDALWRIYSPNKNAIRVKTSLRKLWYSFLNAQSGINISHCFIGKVLYDTEDAIKKLLETPEVVNRFLFPTGWVKSLLLKRNAFSHEKEIRLLFIVMGDSYDLKNTIFQYIMNPFELFDELLFDPRHTEDLFESNKEVFIKLGYKKEIKKSTLYRIPHFDIRLPSFVHKKP